MKKKTVKWAVFLAILLTLVLFCKWYTRPLPFEYFFPYADLVTEIKVNFWVGEDGCDLTTEDPRFDTLMNLFEEAQYRRSLCNLFLKDRFQYAEESGGYWHCMMHIEESVPCEGGTGSGDVFQMENFFGHLRFRNGLIGDGKTWYLNMADQQAFCDAVEQLLKS